MHKIIRLFSKVRSKKELFFSAVHKKKLLLDVTVPSSLHANIILYAAEKSVYTFEAAGGR